VKYIFPASWLLTHDVFYRKPKATSTSTSASVNPTPTPTSAIDDLIPSNTVYVTGLTWDCDEAQLIEHFQAIGSVVKAIIIRKPRRGKLASMGRGLVEFSSPEDAARAISTFNETEFQGRVISCREDRRLTSTSDEIEVKTPTRNLIPNKVLVTNVNPETPTDDLVEHFSVVGDVKKLEKVTIRGKFNGTWIVEYEEDQFAHDAILRLNGSELDGNVLVVREYIHIE
jgi:RNA recognition motif-containing protein